MKCYYEELGIERDANDADIKSAYRKLALRWHPDKNPDCLEEAKQQFLLIQQAYEVLSDAQERAFYDNHREQILRGKNSDYEDNSLDVFQYFTVTCFKGYSDDEKGFYAVYREVFRQIAVEDAEFMEDEEELENVPSFGDSRSSYDEVVGPFYAYWQAYCTKKTYTWLCPYDIKEVKDRRIIRAIEKDMKKVVQKAKKERNEEVRSLVSFVRKRDKRVQAYNKQLEERTALNRQKQEQKRLDQLRQRQRELEEMRQNRKQNAFDDSYEEQLRELEQQYGDSSEDEEIEDEFEDEDTDDVEEEPAQTQELFCVACNKVFKNDRAFANHETSKKHRDNVERLRLEMHQEESAYVEEQVDQAVDEVAKNVNNISIDDKDEEPANGQRKQQKKSKKSKKTKSADLQEEEKHEVPNFINNTVSDEEEHWDHNVKKSTKKRKNKKTSDTLNTTKEGVNLSQFSWIDGDVGEGPPEENEQLTATTAGYSCATCGTRFESKNKLFMHLKITNHSVYLPKPKIPTDESVKHKKGKGKRK